MLLNKRLVYKMSVGDWEKKSQRFRQSTYKKVTCIKSRAFHCLETLLQHPKTKVISLLNIQNLESVGIFDKCWKIMYKRLKIVQDRPGKGRRWFYCSSAILVQYTKFQSISL